MPGFYFIDFGPQNRRIGRCCELWRFLDGGAGAGLAAGRGAAYKPAYELHLCDHYANYIPGALIYASRRASGV